MDFGRSKETGQVVPLGDSIFDNAAYVDGGPDVISHLRQELPGWKCSLLAIDGDVITGVASSATSPGKPPTWW